MERSRLLFEINGFFFSYYENYLSLHYIFSEFWEDSPLSCLRLEICLFFPFRTFIDDMWSIRHRNKEFIITHLNFTSNNAHRVYLKVSILRPNWVYVRYCQPVIHSSASVFYIPSLILMLYLHCLHSMNIFHFQIHLSVH